MALFSKIGNKLMHEFIDIIEWLDDSQDTIVWRFPRYQNEIKNGAKLTVRESQVAVLVNEGQFADIYHPGMYTLTTENMPILSTIKGWKYGFNSPFKVEVYFVNTKQFLNMKWGTANPIMMRDPEFGPIRMRAFGSFCFRVNAQDPTVFIKNVAGTDGQFTTDQINDQLRNFVITKFTDHLAESKIAALDLASNLNEFSMALTAGLQPEFNEYGIELTKFLIENISLPEAVEEALDRRTSMGIVGDMGKYTQFQFANSLEAGAQNGGSPAGDAMGMGMGFAMAGQMAAQIAQNQQKTPPPAPGAVPPPLPPANPFFAVLNGAQAGPFQMAQVQQMIMQGQITRETLVWSQGMAAWAAASTVSQLSSLFGAVPPPPPTL